ncbi:hypothetical protein [Labrys monachus]|nr:hypothetical protein [Labrys monachus]
MLAIALIRLLLSPSGAIGRSMFAIGAMLLIAAAMGVDHVMNGWTGPSGVASFAFVVVFAWSALSLSRKRLHDFGWSGLTIVAFLGLYLAAMALAMLLLDRAAMASWSGALAKATLFSGPMAGWLIALAIIPGEGPPAPLARLR